ncbi:MAG: PAS domain S-box protein, partial [Candidatus Paceibacterota bacterium]
MTQMKPSIPELVAEREDLRARLAEAEEVLNAIRNGEVDAVVVAGEHGEQVYTLCGANRIYRELIETMGEGAVTLSADGVILYCNAYLAKLLGRHLDQVLGSALRNHMPPADQQALDSILALAPTAPNHREINLQTSEGRLVPVYLSAFCFLNDGAGMVFCLVLTDLTEQKSHEQIAADERLAREILEQTVETIVVCDEEGRVIRASQAAQQFCDGSPLLQLFAEAFPLRTQASKPFQLAPVLQGETLRNVDMDLERQGQKFELILNAGPLLSGQQILGCVVTLTDITERKRIEAALQKTNEYLGSFFSYANAPIIVWDPQFHITNVNHAFESLVGRKAREVVGRPLEALFPPDSVASSMELIKGTLGEERLEMIEIKIQHRDGSVRTVLWNSATVFDADGKTPIAGFAQGQDITVRKRTEEALATMARRNQTLLQAASDGIHVLDE